MATNQLITLFAYMPSALVDGARAPLQTPPALRGGELFAPLQFFTNVLGASAEPQGNPSVLRLAGRECACAPGEMQPAVACARALGVCAQAFGEWAAFGDETRVAALTGDAALRARVRRETRGIYNAAYFTGADFKAGRGAWRKDLCGDRVTNNPSVPGIARLLALRDEDSLQLRAQMNRGENIPILFGDNPPTESRDLKQQYDRIVRMAQPFGTVGCKGYRDPELLKDVIYAMDWMHDHMYGANVLSDSSFRSYRIFNWWEWFVGGACPMLDAVMIIEEFIPREQVNKYILPIQFIRTQMRVSLTPSESMSRILPLVPLSLLSEDRAMLQAMYVDMEKLLETHETGDCMREDGCCMTHGMSYNICYGTCNLVRVAKMLRVLKGTPLEFPCADAYNLMHMIRYTFAPVLYRGQGLNMMNGRYMQGEASEVALSVMTELYNAFGIFGEGEDDEICEILARNKTPETEEGLISHYTGALSLEDYRKINVMEEHTQPPKTNIAYYAMLRKALTSPKYGKKPYTLGHMWYTGDCCVQFRRDYAFALRMSSERLPGYECINSANGDAWYTGDGMLYLYAPGDGRQFGASWWKNVDKYHMPGVTADTQPRQNIFLDRAYKNTMSFVGGVELDAQYLAASMDLESFHNDVDEGRPDRGYGQSLPVHNCTLRGQKTWFFFDKAVVALGASIRARDGFEVHTTIENRRVIPGMRPFAVNGEVLPEETFSRVYANARTLWIPGVGGYYFPGGAALTCVRETRGSETFFKCYLNHGLSPDNARYAYVILPGMSPAETEAYAQNPGVEILANEPGAQIAREIESGLTGCALREAYTDADFSAQTPLIALYRKQKGALSLCVSDPTQKRDEIAFAIPGAWEAVSADPRMEITRETAVTRVRANARLLRGRGLTAAFRQND